MTATATAAYMGTFGGTSDQVGRARHEVASYLDGCPVADDAILIVSELAANAVTHSRSRHASFIVRCELYPGYVWAEVEDRGGPWDPGAADADSGRGLGIVAALAAEWGIDGDARGRAVWARIEW